MSLHHQDWRKDDPISIEQRNPKREGTAAHSRYDKYKRSRTIAHALHLGAASGDISHDIKRGYIRELPKARVGTVSSVRSSKCRPLGPYTHVLSLGSRCLVANTMENLGLRRYAGPFDWVYTNPQMVRHCVQNNFREFLSRRQMRANSDRMFGHELYSGMLGMKTVWPHHDPWDKHRSHFLRTVKRFRRIMDTKGNKLFIYIELAKSGKKRVASGGEWRDMVRLFDALLEKNVGNCELLYVRVACRRASSATGSSSACVKKNTQALVEGRSRLSVHELHCCGDCTGKYLKKDEDVDAFEDLLVSGRKFKLMSDPSELGKMRAL